MKETLQVLDNESKKWRTKLRSKKNGKGQEILQKGNRIMSCESFFVIDEKRKIFGDLQTVVRKELLL